ncbi:hypothetical protein FRC00_002952 [Tulasnella sp. 408]|nr:hypothetical protein FRC00_002952 [Tulasnella sp. 408]
MFGHSRSTDRELNPAHLSKGHRVENEFETASESKAMPARRRLAARCIFFFKRARPDPLAQFWGFVHLHYRSPTDSNHSAPTAGPPALYCFTLHFIPIPSVFTKSIKPPPTDTKATPLQSYPSLRIDLILHPCPWLALAATETPPSQTPPLKSLDNDLGLKSDAEADDQVSSPQPPDDEEKEEDSIKTHKATVKKNAKKKRAMSTASSDGSQQDSIDVMPVSKKSKLERLRIAKSYTERLDGLEAILPRAWDAKFDRAGLDIEASSRTGIGENDGKPSSAKIVKPDRKKAKAEKSANRIKALIAWEDKANNLFAPSKVARAGIWSKVGPNQEWTWCSSSPPNNPVFFCCVGRVAYRLFYSEGLPKREVSVSLDMVEPRDRHLLTKFLKRHSSDPSPEWENVKFSRFQAKRDEADAKPFKHYYDARNPESYGKSDAKSLSVQTDLHHGDLVIVEATAIRFASTGSPGKKWSSSPEKKWVARFRLMSLWKLKDSEEEWSDDDSDSPKPSHHKGKGKELHEELSSRGYELVRVAESPSLTARQRRCGITSVKEYARKPDGFMKGSRINVVIAEDDTSILTPVLCSPTTATMGYLTADSIHHLYPDWTFRRIARRTNLTLWDFAIPEESDAPNGMGDGLVETAGSRTYGGRHVERLAQDGFTVQRCDEKPSGPCNIVCPATIRSFNDGHSWRLTFDPEGKARSPWNDPASEGHAGKGAQTRLRGGLCSNQQCPNYGHRM